MWSMNFEIKHNKDVTPNKASCFLVTPLPNLHVTIKNQKLNYDKLTKSKF